MGKNWLDPAELARDNRVFSAFVLVLAGMASWEVLSTLWFDISIVRRKRPWRWPMVLYFITRICMLLHIFAFAVTRNAIQEIPCQRVAWISKVADATGTCCATLILALRTRAICLREVKISVVLGALCCGQIAVWAQTFRYTVTRWDPQRNLCAVVSTAPRPLLVTVFAYTMALDLIVLIICVYKLSNNRYSNGLATQLFRDGILYFVAAFGANFVAMVMAVLALNPTMNVICLPFACVISVIAATTIFRNVFTLYDSFSGTTKGDSSNRAISELNRLNNPARITVATGGTRHITSNNIPLGDYKSQYTTHHDYAQHEMGGISVHKVVDVEPVPPINLGKVASQGSTGTTEKGQAF